MSQKVTQSWISAKLVFRLLFGIMLIAALVYIFNIQAIIKAICSARPEYLFAAIVVYSITLLILSTRWRMIVSCMGGHLSISDAYQAFIGGVLLSDLTPMRIGDLSRPFIVRKELDINLGIASVAVDRFADIATVSLLGLSGIMLLSMHRGGWFIVPSLAAPLIILSIAALFWMKRPFILDLIERFGYIRVTVVAKALNEVFDNLSDIKRLMAKSIFLTLIAWIGHALRIVLIARSFGYNPPIQLLFFLQPLVSALSLVPITLSGLGLTEGGLTALLAEVSIPLAIGLSIALIDRALTVAFHILVGWRYAVRVL
jgi:uncharacterized protein (TIRG00374 family)